MSANIGLGISDFKMLRVRNNYFIDKSLFIKNVIDNQSGVILITRPRRFGKTLNMSMLRYFFNIDCKDSKELFKDLKIMNAGEKYTSQMNKYPCIYLTMKDVNSPTYEGMLMDFRSSIVDMYVRHMYILESDKIYEFEKAKINDILYLRASDEVLKTAVKDLSKYLSRIYDMPVYIFIDEYDVPLQNAYVEGIYENVVKFLKGFYQATFKDNEFAEKAVLTGVSRIAKESIFSRTKQFRSLYNIR